MWRLRGSRSLAGPNCKRRCTLAPFAPPWRHSIPPGRGCSCRRQQKNCPQDKARRCRLQRSCPQGISRGKPRGHSHPRSWQTACSCQTACSWQTVQCWQTAQRWQTAQSWQIPQSWQTAHGWRPACAPRAAACAAAAESRPCPRHCSRPRPARAKKRPAAPQSLQRGRSQPWRAARAAPPRSPPAAPASAGAGAWATKAGEAKPRASQEVQAKNLKARRELGVPLKPAARVEVAREGTHV